jgi:hypothetical protein
MPTFICSKCGRESESTPCPACAAATSVAAQEHAAEAKVVPPPADGAFREGEPLIQREIVFDETTPSILKKYHPRILSFVSFFSFWRFFEGSCILPDSFI